ncbi:hypothetical protein [uncultured Pontibacter sp.]|uniref:hypothetical protein n=1 Tax=uncultured Pontibacter sp. TaxID=453356 RepID=UPI0026210AFE|nr:hypothetical protein [uncultured Pontibacter sp.]
MKMKDIKAFTLAVALGLFTTMGLSACNTGTDPGETNTERSGIREEGSMVEDNSDNTMEQYSDTTDMEDHYDHTESGKQGGAVHDGTGKEGGVERDDVNN